MQAAPCPGPCKQSQATAVVVASQTPFSNTGSTPRYSEPWRRFTSTSIISKSTLNRLKIGELRDVLQERGLSTEGLKADLVERMHADLHDQGQPLAISPHCLVAEVYNVFVAHPCAFAPCMTNTEHCQLPGHDTLQGMECQLQHLGRPAVQLLSAVQSLFQVRAAQQDSIMSFTTIQRHHRRQQ